eukprot:scaffold14723_cov282-Ochromonas_danica.AAC.1
MESYCPALRSIEIDTSTAFYLCKEDQLKSNLSVFLSHCHNLEGVTVLMNTDRQAKQVGDVVMEVLVEKLRENSLVKFSLQDIESYEECHVMVANLLQKHASSLRDLDISIVDGMGIDLIISTLIENRIRLRGLNVYIKCESMQKMNYLVSYISLTGELLEIVKVAFGVEGYPVIDDLVVALCKSCPKLINLVISHSSMCSAENLLHLFEQCPHLQDVVIDEFIQTCNEDSSVTIEVEGSNDDWAVCLSHILRRRQYKQVTLILNSDYYMPVGILKPLLEPYQITFLHATSEACLISLLRDLPHLNCLDLWHFNANKFTDATLAALMEHAKSLTKLHVSCYKPSLLNFSDMLPELIKSCELIESLVLGCCGLESLVAVSKHSCLSEVNLITSESVSDEMLDELLLDEKDYSIVSIENLITGSNSVKSDKIDGSTRTYLSVSRHCVCDDRDNTVTIGSVITSSLVIIHDDPLCAIVGTSSFRMDLWKQPMPHYGGKVTSSEQLTTGRLLCSLV